MKKKKFFRFLSICFCCMFLLFAGCSMDGNGGSSDDPSVNAPENLAGVKVLSKPSEYDFSEAVGSWASEYYYNLFARETLLQLYRVYADFSISNSWYSEIFKDETTENGLLSEEDGLTYPSFGGEGREGLTKYYLYDSLRYTITKVETTTDSNGDETQKLTLELNPWNWTIDVEAKGKENLFKTTNSVVKCYAKDNSSIKVEIDYDDWRELVQQDTFKTPNYMEYYAFDTAKSHILEVDGKENIVNEYGYSPYIVQHVDTEAGVTAANYFQDALEYVTYLFVLGYDYKDANGQATNEADLFEMIKDFDANGALTGIRVGGWENQPISIVDALVEVKQLYQEYGNFVGITQKNKQQIHDYILDKVIGQKASEKSVFEVEMISYTKDASGVTTLNPTQPENLKFNRNYDKIVSNVIDYACTQAPIGYDATYDNGDGTFGRKVNLDESYLASTITDYKGDYFGMSYQGENNTDDEAFEHIKAAEFQSMILYPRSEQVGFDLTDIWLAFEYYDDSENPHNLKYLKEKGLDLNVGFRYFDSSANNGEGAYTFAGETSFSIAYGKYTTFSDPDRNKLYISEDGNGFADLWIEEKVKINTEFNKDIGGGVINPFYGDETEDYTKSILISGNNKAKDYYKLNDSSSYGFYGTLNENKFSKAVAGDEGCDFIEVYFDIVKQKGMKGINYNFKVAMFGYYTSADFPVFGN